MAGNSWHIVYHRKEPYTSRDGGPETAPARGVQVIVQDHPTVGVELVTGADYYVWRDGRWWGADVNGLWDYLCMPGWKVVLFGRMVTQVEYDKAVGEANVVKHAWHPRERRTG